MTYKTWSPAIADFFDEWRHGLDLLQEPCREALLGPVRTAAEDTLRDYHEVRGVIDPDDRRRVMISDWTLRTLAPAWCDLADLQDVGAELRGLEQQEADWMLELGDGTISRASEALFARLHPIALRVQRELAAAKEAARRGGHQAEWWGAQQAATWARTLCGFYASAAVMSEDQRGTIWTGALNIVRDASLLAAWNTVGGMSIDAARHELRPTVDPLMRSALDLVLRMCAIDVRDLVLPAVDVDQIAAGW